MSCLGRAKNPKNRIHPLGESSKKANEGPISQMYLFMLLIKAKRSHLQAALSFFVDSAVVKNVNMSAMKTTPILQLRDFMQIGLWTISWPVKGHLAD